jgi:predicted small lipoprotein YifL
MKNITIIFCLAVLLTVSGCGMKRALTPPEPKNKQMADEKDLVEF